MAEKVETTPPSLNPTASKTTKHRAPQRDPEAPPRSVGSPPSTSTCGHPKAPPPPRWGSTLVEAKRASEAEHSGSLLKPTRKLRAFLN
ncbi:hypothetical protein NL676_001364 [Syzygium grande]|nr:hypothetical protein NL676_001364 [Syzygium grande]